MRAIAAFLIAAACAFAGWMLFGRARPVPRPPFRPPAVGVVTRFPARSSPAKEISIASATSITFMRDFITAFQRERPNVAVVYVDMLSSQLLDYALRTCDDAERASDLIISVSSDHLVDLANRGCSRAVPAAVAAHSLAQWRSEVLAFSEEPAVFVFDTRHVEAGQVPHSHLGLLKSMRSRPRFWLNRIGTYDIEQSGIGYGYASADARQAAIYGRLIESFGRARVRTYCCSDEMVRATVRGDIVFAYNVQLSYAYAAQRSGRPIGIVIPSDYQATQFRSVMMTRQSRDSDAAIAFIATLMSPAGRHIADRLITPPPGKPAIGTIDRTGSRSLPPLNSSLLALRDHARRSRFVLEWRRAVLAHPDERATIRIDRPSPRSGTRSRAASELQHPLP